MGTMIELPDMSRLQFDDACHIYRLDGIIIPSVSTVMKPLSEAEYGTISTRTLEKAAYKGTAVHNSIENWLKFDIEDIEPEYRGYFEAFVDWWKLRNPELIGSEVRVYHMLLRYAGTIDLLLVIDGELVLVDIKTTYKIIEMTCGVQLEGYSKALSSHGIHVKRKLILHLKKDGKWDECEFPANDPDRWRVFGSLKCVYDYIQSSK